jgi:hypothetical protein
MSGLHMGASKTFSKVECTVTDSAYFGFPFIVLGIQNGKIVRKNLRTKELKEFRGYIPSFIGKCES